jgi:transposase
MNPAAASDLLRTTMTLRNYVENLRAEVDRLNRVREIERQAEAAAKLAESIRLIKRGKPLDEQISELMRSLPPALRDRPWTMAELVQQLNGRYRDRPHAKQVGDALRRLGWTRIRLWSNGADGQRVWVR